MATRPRVAYRRESRLAGHFKPWKPQSLRPRQVKRDRIINSRVAAKRINRAEHISCLLPAGQIASAVGASAVGGFRYRCKSPRV